MKKIITICAAILMTASLWAQSPEKMSYQAVVRDGSNNLVSSTAVGMQISILQGSANGTVLYVENQTPTSNTNGLVSLEIGAGTIVSGNFTTIDWANGPYFIKTETDPTGGSAYTITGTSQLMSVPYALHAKTAESIIEPIYTIGLWPELGGYVFWVSVDGKHGLVSETQDQGTSSWYNAQNVISNPIFHSAIGQYYRDWRLPTNTERNEMFNQKIAIGGFGGDYYWSSTESSANNALYQNFSTGVRTGYLKSNISNVRAVREF
jgi:hypothetical protein